MYGEGEHEGLNIKEAEGIMAAVLAFLCCSDEDSGECPAFQVLTPPFHYRPSSVG